MSFTHSSIHYSLITLTHTHIKNPPSHSPTPLSPTIQSPHNLPHHSSITICNFSHPPYLDKSPSRIQSSTPSPSYDFFPQSRFTGISSSHHKPNSIKSIRISTTPIRRSKKGTPNFFHKDQMRHKR